MSGSKIETRQQSAYRRCAQTHCTAKLFDALNPWANRMIIGLEQSPATVMLMSGITKQTTLRWLKIAPLMSPTVCRHKSARCLPV